MPGLSPRLPRQRPLLGVGLVLLMSLCFATMDSTARLLGAHLPVLLFFWARYVFQATVMAGVLLLRGGGAFRSAHPRFQALRGLLLALTSAMSFYGVQAMPVPEFTAVVMLTPLLVIALSAWWLRERVSPGRWALVAGGCLGALVVVRPGSGLFGLAVLFPLAAALSYASFQVLTRRLAGHEHPTTTHFYTGLVGTALLTPVLWASPIDVPATLAAAAPAHIGQMLLIGALGTLGHLLLIVALTLAPPGMLMPFIPTQIAWATALGWWLFGQTPDGWALLGMALIAACGATGAWLNTRAAAP